MNRRFALLCILVLLTACATPTAPEPAGRAQPTGEADTATPIRTSTIIPPPTVAVTSTPEAGTLPTVAPINSISMITQTVALAPWEPLQTDAIIDRPVRNLRPLTDGTVKYRQAAWSPDGGWIAAVPQDGPGMDVINSATGAVRQVVTETYVLEPLWSQPDTLIVQRVTTTTDQLVQITMEQQAIRAAVIVEQPQPLRGVGSNGAGVTYGAAAQLFSIGAVQGDSRSVSWRVPLDILISAPANNGQAIAVNPWTNNLEQVQTLLLRANNAQLTSTPLSEPGEGWWLPRWSPDDSKLALTSIGGRIGTATGDGSARYDLGPGDTPAWSPDGSRIAYAGASAGADFTKRDIYIVDWQGQGPRLRLTNANEVELFASPSWSPNGQQLAFVEIDSGQVFIGDVP